MYKNENGILTLEGTGLLKMNDTNIPVTYKFNRIVLNEKSNRETGSKVRCFSIHANTVDTRAHNINFLRRTLST